MKISTRNPELYRAMRKVMEKVPALVADARPATLRDVVKRLAAQGMPEAALVKKASAKELGEIRKALIKDVFSKKRSADTAQKTGERKAAAKPTALVSGGSYTGMLAAVALAKSGNQVTLVEARPQHSRDIRLGIRQGTLDVLAAIDPELAQRVIDAASPMLLEHMSELDEHLGETGEFKPLDAFGDPPRAPDASKVPLTGAALMESRTTHVVVARELEEVVEEYVKEKYPDIRFVEGKLHAEKTEKGVDFTLDKTGKDGVPLFEEFLDGKKPSLVIVAEGSSSPTRGALGVKTAESTPLRYWTAGLVKSPDPSVPEGQATYRGMYRESEAVDPATGEKVVVNSRAVAISDGKEATWLLAEMPPFYNPDPAMAQEEVNAHYLDVGSLVTGRSRDELEAAGVAGPIKREGSVPTAFGLQGKAAQQAALVLDDGTVIGMVGDTDLTSSFQAGGGANTAMSEVLDVMKLAANLQSGMKPALAARSFQAAVFERADAWAAAGIPYFYAQSTPDKTQRLAKQHLKAIADWRRKGGDSPLTRLEAMLKEASVAGEPMGMKLAA